MLLEIEDHTSNFLYSFFVDGSGWCLPPQAITFCYQNLSLKEERLFLPPCLRLERRVFLKQGG